MEPGLAELRERVAVLEQVVHYELAELRRSVVAMEHSSPLHLPSGMSGVMIIKLAIAIALPVLVFLATGDPHKAATAARLLP